MSVVLVSSSVVFLTEDHVPSLNHDFLANQKIIPEDFKKKNDSISTPIVSHINYENGFTVIVDPKKTLIQFQNSSAEEKDILENLNLLKGIASKYLNFFKTLTYKAIGLNFDFVKETLDYTSFIKKNIQKDDSLNFENNKGDIRNIELSYNSKGKQFNIKILKAKRTDQEEYSQNKPPTFVPLFQTNTHYTENYNENKVTIIEELEDNYNRLKKFIGSF